MKGNEPVDLWKRVAIGDPSECWEWAGPYSSNRYGVFSLYGRSVSTHRLAYELTHGSIPEGLFVLHRCDNPPCCNPAHLYAGTAADNSRDRRDRGRQPSKAGSLHHLAKLTEAQALSIRERRIAGERVVDLAREFKVSSATICRIAKGYGWTHIGQAA